MEGELGVWVEKVKGLRSTNWILQNSHREVKYSIRSIVNNIEVTMHGARKVLDLSRERVVSYINV